MSDNLPKNLELTDTEKLVVYHFGLSNKLATSAVEHALITGEGLIKVKLDAGHGQYEKRLKLIGIPLATAGKYVRLVKNSNHYSCSDLEGLSLSTMLEFFSASDEVKTEVNQRLDNGETVSGAEIKRLKLAEQRIAELEQQNSDDANRHKLALEVVQKTASDSATREQEALQHGKEFRQQDRDKRNKLRELQAIVDAGLKPEIIYIANDKEAFKQLDEEWRRKYSNSEADVKKFHDQFLTQKRTQVQQVDAGVQTGLDKHKDKILDMQIEETKLDAAISLKCARIHELNTIEGGRLAHKTALADFHGALLVFQVAASILVEGAHPHPLDYDQWRIELQKAYACITWFQDHLATINPEPADKIIDIEKPVESKNTNL